MHHCELADQGGLPSIPVIMSASAFGGGGEWYGMRNKMGGMEGRRSGEREREEEADQDALASVLQAPHQQWESKWRTVVCVCELVGSITLTPSAHALCPPPGAGAATRWQNA